MMRLWSGFLCVSLMLCVCAFAQEKSKGGGGGPPKPDKDSELAMADFGRTMALQADDIQKDQLHDIQKCAGDVDKALSQPVSSDAVKNAVPNIACEQTNWKELVKDLRKAQRNGLKAQLAAANKSAAELDRAAQGAKDAAQLKSANAQFWTSVKAIATEMGVELK